MKFEELTQRIIDEKLDEYVYINVGSLDGSYNSIGIERNDDGTFNIAFHDERGEEMSSFHNLPEEEACRRVYASASATKRIKMRIEAQKKNNGESVKF